MKVALYIEDGLEQIVLTPETETERGIIGKLGDDSRTLEIKRGSFFKCQGGWVRYGAAHYDTGMFGSGQQRDDESTMIVLRRKVAEQPPPPPPQEDDGLGSAGVYA
jgi:hypothetical protein